MTMKLVISISMIFRRGGPRLIYILQLTNYNLQTRTSPPNTLHLLARPDILIQIILKSSACWLTQVLSTYMYMSISV